MRIGIIGAGHIGGTLAALFLKAGHEVAVSNSRGPETLQDLVSELGEGARAMTPAEAAAYGELAVVSIPFGRYREVPAEAFTGKVVIDTNNYYPQRDGHFAELDSGGRTSSELLQAHLSGSRVVKAFNTQYWHQLRDRGRPPGSPDRVAVPIAGDDEEAKRLVASVIEQIGYDVVDLGGLAFGGRRMQPGSPIYGKSLAGEEIHRRVAA